MNEKTILATETVDRIIRMLGSGYYFDDLKVLQAAIDKRGALPQDYFCREENCCCETWGFKWRSKDELRIIRETLITRLVEQIKAQNYLPYKEKMATDHYARYFHALTILKADKTLINHSKNDLIRNAFIELWQMDDGTDEAWQHIDSAAWFLSEAINGLKQLPVRETIYPEE